MNLNQVAGALTLWALSESLGAIGCVKISILAILNRTNYTVVQKMITRNEIVGAILDACPSFKPVYAALCADGNAELTYIVLDRFASHLVELHQTGSEADFSDVAELIERMHTEGDEYVREAATIGLLEGIQNYSGGSELDLVYFRSILIPESQRWWDSINRFWQKEIPFVGADLQTENPMHNKSAHPTAGNVLL